MSSIRGTRCIASYGLKLYRVQQQRRLASIAIPALSRTLRKVVFQEGSVIPVNKYDLSGGCGILSSTCSAMFSTATDAMGYDEPSNIDTADPDSVEECRWPSPVHQQTAKTYTKDRSIFVGGYNFDHNQSVLTKLFSQFGEVTDITIPRLQIYNQVPSSAENYRFAFIEFNNKESALKALQAGSVTSEKGIQVDIKPRSELTKKEKEQQRTFVLKNLPENITVLKCMELFKSVGNLEMVNIVFNSMIQKYEGTTFAFLVFKEIPEISTLESISKTISDQVTVEPMKNVRKLQPRTRNKKIFVEQLPFEITVDRLAEHFNSFGEVSFTKVFDAKKGNGARSAIVEFKSEKEATRAAQETLHQLDGNDVTVRSLGWSSVEL